MDEDRLQTLGLRLAGLRKKKKLLQKQLAPMLDVHRQTITDIEKGKRDPSFLTVARWVAVCEGEYASIEEEIGRERIERRVSPGRRDEDKERATIVDRYGRKFLIEMSEKRAEG